jgi:hypothetical protein
MVVSVTAEFPRHQGVGVAAAEGDVALADGITVVAPGVAVLLVLDPPAGYRGFTTRLSPKSVPPMRRPKRMTVATTTPVIRQSSSRVGQMTFFSSSQTLLK